MRFLTAFFLAVLIMALPSKADTMTPAQKSDVENIVHDYLMSHPEILRDMANALEIQDKKTEADTRGKMLTSQADQMFRDKMDAVVGNPKGDVTIVEFMDYNCGWCRKSISEMQSLVKTDPKIRVVMKEFPIFGEGSEYAAKAALASVKQGKYWDFHQALFAAEGKVTPAVTDDIATKIGLNLKQLKTDMQDPKIAENIAGTQKLAQAMLLTGTPAFVVDGKVFPGYVPVADLQASIAQVRANGGCKYC